MPRPVRPRPPFEEPGAAPTRPKPITAAAAFDLIAEVDRLVGERVAGGGDDPAGAPAKDRSIRILAKEAGFRLVLMTLGAGACLERHVAPGWLTVQPIAGRVRFDVGDQTHDLPAGRLIVVPPRVPHAVEAIEETALLLTIAAPED